MHLWYELIVSKHGNKSSFILIMDKLKSWLAEPWLLPDKAFAYLITWLARRFRSPIDSFGWLQAILYSWKVDVWRRYVSATQQIKTLDRKPVNVLDVGGGTGVIGEFLDPNYYQLCILDINVKFLRTVEDSRLNRVVGDGCSLPFKDDCFGVVISVDSLQYVSQSKRTEYCNELKRVAGNFVIIHCPVDSSDGKFQGTTYDVKFLQWHRQRFKKDEPYTREQLNLGLPQFGQLLQLFPNASMIGEQNVEIWLEYMKREYSPYMRFINGLLYKLRLESRDNLPPYHSCLLCWRKQ